jgi:hypothetical protein
MITQNIDSRYLASSILLVDGEYKDDNSSFGIRTLEFPLEAMLTCLSVLYTMAYKQPRAWHGLRLVSFNSCSQNFTGLKMVREVYMVWKLSSLNLSFQPSSSWKYYSESFS